MRNPNKMKPELVLAFWPEGRGTEIFGNGRDYNGDIEGCASFNITLRGILPDPDASTFLYPECDAMGDLILRMHITATREEGGTYTIRTSVQLMYGTIYYADLPKIEARAKLLKRLHAAACEARMHATDGDTLTTLAQACEAYGIRRAIVFRSGKRDREFAPLAIVLFQFAQAIDARCKQLPGFARRLEAA